MRPATFTVGFDLDLTLVDSAERIVASYLRAFADHDVALTAAQLTPLLGLPLDLTAARLAPHLEVTSFIGSYRRHYDAPDAPPHRALPGARAALEAVRDLGGRAVVVSAKFARAVHVALAESDLADLVDTVHAECFAAGKSQALLAETARIYVGDHEADMTAARAAQCVAVGVTTGAFTARALRTAGAAAVLTELDAFGPWLRTALA